MLKLALGVSVFLAVVVAFAFVFERSYEVAAWLLQLWIPGFCDSIIKIFMGGLVFEGQGLLSNVVLDVKIFHSIE